MKTIVIALGGNAILKNKLVSTIYKYLYTTIPLLYYVKEEREIYYQMSLL